MVCRWAIKNTPCASIQRNCCVLWRLRAPGDSPTRQHKHAMTKAWWTCQQYANGRCTHHLPQPPTLTIISKVQRILTWTKKCTLNDASKRHTLRKCQEKKPSGQPGNRNTPTDQTNNKKYLRGKNLWSAISAWIMCVVAQRTGWEKKKIL